MASSAYDWSATASSNGNADADIEAREGVARVTGVNDNDRQIMAKVAQLLGDLNGTKTAGGTADALTVTANSGFTAYAQGRILAFKAASDNTSTVTLNVNSIGAKAVVKMTSAGETALAAGDIQAGGVFVVRYDTAVNSSAGGWLLENPVRVDLATLASPTFTGVATSPRFSRSGNVSAAAWGLAGIGYNAVAGTYTDTSSSGTVTNVTVHAFATPTLAASSSTTFTHAPTLYVAGPPTAGSNVTLTNAYAFWVDAGNTRLDGMLSVGTGAAPAATIHAGGNVSAAQWATNGIGLRLAAATYTDTSSSGTVAAQVAYAFATPTFAASSSTTYSDASTLYVAAAPSAGTNVTITRGWALYVAAGRVFINGSGLSLNTTNTLGLIEMAASLTGAAWGASGRVLRLAPNIMTDTSSSGTVAIASVNGLGGGTFAASSVTTYTDAATLYIGNVPGAGTNVTITNPWALWVDAGNVRFDADIYRGTTKILGAQGAAVADATDAASAITQLNTWLARARAHGLIAT